MKKMMYIIGLIISLTILIFIIGLFLPPERIVIRKGHFNTSPENLYEILTNNNDWQYRKSLKDLVIIENKDGVEVWDEISHDGATIRFTTREKHPFSFYSFDMDSKLFSGYWTGEFKPDNKGGTIFTSTEYIKVKNPFVKTLSYLFFDIARYMSIYQDDLQEKLNERDDFL